MRYLDATTVAAAGPAVAARAIRDALRGGFDPAHDPARSAVPLSHGQILLMPSETSRAAGVKIATVAPDNPRLGLPRVQASYLLLDRETLAARALLDGTALTTLRTPAVSVTAVEGVLPAGALRLVVIGHGPQARAHVAALAAVRELSGVTFLVRDPSRAPVASIALDDSVVAADALTRADVVVCATSAREPLFDSRLISDEAIVIAVGSHEPDARELDSALLRRGTVIVEDHTTALREAGDVMMAIAEGALVAADLVALRDVVDGRVHVPRDRPVVVKTVGMAWEDLVVAEAVLDQQDSGAAG